MDWGQKSSGIWCHEGVNSINQENLFPDCKPWTPKDKEKMLQKSSNIFVASEESNLKTLCSLRFTDFRSRHIKYQC